MSLEADIEKKVTKYAEKTGWTALKFTPHGSRGWPDHIYLGPCGVTVWIEFKKPGEKLKKLQVYRINQMLNLGHIATWFDNVEDACNFLDSARLPAESDPAYVASVCRWLISRSGTRED